MTLAAEIDAAIDNTIAVSQEWAGEGIRPKLACFGLEFEDVHAVIRRRWEDYKHDIASAEDAFTKGYAEALMVGKQL